MIGAVSLHRRVAKTQSKTLRKAKTKTWNAEEAEVRSAGAAGFDGGSRAGVRRLGFQTGPLDDASGLKQLGTQ